MKSQRFIAYYRVSTVQQERSGLGLDAQQHAVTRFLQDRDCELIGSFTEVETGKGANALHKRPELRAALNECKKQGATLLIAKLDRLARNVHFVSGLLETGCDFIAADMPSANKVMIQMYAVMAEWERDQISARTKAALSAAKARGVRLGAAGAQNLNANLKQRREASKAFAEPLREVISGFQSAGLSQRAIVVRLNTLGIRAAKGGGWSLSQLQRVIRCHSRCKVQPSHE